MEDPLTSSMTIIKSFLPNRVSIKTIQKDPISPALKERVKTKKIF